MVGHIMNAVGVPYRAEDVVGVPYPATEGVAYRVPGSDIRLALCGARCAAQ